MSGDNRFDGNFDNNKNMKLNNGDNASFTDYTTIKQDQPGFLEDFFKQAGRLVGESTKNFHNLDRDKFTQRMRDALMHYDYNVMVIKKENAVFYGDPRIQENSFEVSCGNGFWTLLYATYFRIYYAPKGVKWTIVNNGDGGYINWAFGGSFDRDGGTVHFK